MFTIGQVVTDLATGKRGIIIEVNQWIPGDWNGWNQLNNYSVKFWSRNQKGRVRRDVVYLHENEMR